MRQVFVAALFTTMAVFLLGIFLGYTLSTHQLTNIISLEFRVYSRLEGLRDLNYDCNDLYEVSRHFDHIFTDLVLLKTSYKDPDLYRAAMELFYVLEYDHMGMAEKCGYKRVIYFRSSNCVDCSSQEDVLAYIRSARKDIMVYYFDLDVPSPLLDHLVEKYGVTGAPTLIVDGRVYRRFVPPEEIVD